MGKNMKKPSGKKYECEYSSRLDYNRRHVGVDPENECPHVYLDVCLLSGVRETTGSIRLTPGNARRLARDLKRAAKIAEKVDDHAV